MKYKGFTVIELIVVFALTTIMLSAIYWVYYSSFKLNSRAITEHSFENEFILTDKIIYNDFTKADSIMLYNNTLSIYRDSELTTLLFQDSVVVRNQSTLPCRYLQYRFETFNNSNDIKSLMIDWIVSDEVVHTNYLNKITPLIRFKNGIKN